MEQQDISVARYFEEFEVGNSFVSRARTITETDVVMFAGLTGDYNPLHVNEEYAKTTGFGTRVAHGVLGMAISTGLTHDMGIYAGTALAYRGMKNWYFKGPIFIGDTIHVIQTVQETKWSSRGDRGTVTFLAQIVNQKGEIVQEGERMMIIKARTKGEV